MEKYTKNPYGKSRRRSLLKNVYDTRKKKIRKKVECISNDSNNERNNNHHVLNNNSSKENNLKIIKTTTTTSENLLENLPLGKNVNRYRRKVFPITLFLLVYCYVCSSAVSSFGVVANDEIHYPRSNISLSSIDRTRTTETTGTPSSSSSSSPTTHTFRSTSSSSLSPSVRNARDVNVALNDEPEYDDEEEDEPEEDYDITKNKSAKGMYVGAPCELSCNVMLHHVFCDPATNTCGCEKNYPVLIDRRKGCAKPKKLGEQCLYHEICAYSDPNSLCVQIKHNAICECAEGFHSVSYLKPTKRIFCTQDLEVITSNLPTLLGVITSITVLGGLICMVLYLFSKNKYPRARDYGDAHLSPPIMYASDTARPSSRSSQRSSGSISSYGHRRTSGVPLHGSKGVLVSASRTGSRRPSLASVHSSSSSVKSYSMKRFEQEIQQKELRQEMKKQLTKLQEQQQLQRVKPCIIIGDAIPFTVTRTILPTPSPITPKSTDELLPSVCEEQEFSPSLSSTKSGNSSNIIPVDDVKLSVNRASTSKDFS